MPQSETSHARLVPCAKALLRAALRMTRPQPVGRLQELGQRFHQLTQSRNAELAHAWYRLAIASDYPGLEPTLDKVMQEKTQ